MDPTICYRFDVDTRLCARDGVPKLLDVFAKHDAVASFYTVLGREEPYPWVWFQQRILGRRPAAVLSSEPRPKRSKITKREFLRRIVRPVVFAKEQSHNLRRVIDEGHELGCHSVGHEDWALNLPRLNPDREFDNMARLFKEYFDAEPNSFAAPTFRTDKRVLDALDSHGFAVAGDLQGDEPFRPVVNGHKYKHVQVPVNVMRRDTVPLTEHYWRMGWGDEQIAKAVCEEIESRAEHGLPAVVYGHPILEGGSLIGVVERVLAWCDDNDFEFVTARQLAKRYSNNFKAIEIPER